PRVPGRETPGPPRPARRGPRWPRERAGGASSGVLVEREDPQAGDLLAAVLAVTGRDGDARRVARGAVLGVEEDTARDSGVRLRDVLDQLLAVQEDRPVL